MSTVRWFTLMRAGTSPGGTELAQNLGHLQCERQSRDPSVRAEERLLRGRDAESFPDEVVTKLLTVADSDNNGYINFNEFVNLCEKTKRSPGYRHLLRRGAFIVIPRSGRDAETRRYLDEYSCCPPPLFMISITLIEVGVFVYYAVDMNQTMETNQPAPIYSPLTYNPQRRYEAWRYITYALIHSGYMHLVNNLIMQVVLGTLLELVHKWWRVMLVYFAGVAAGSLATSVTSPSTYLAGASGGVYAIVYAYIGNLILNWSEMFLPWIQVIVLAVLMSFDVGFAIWDTYFAEQVSSTGHMAHLGGALAGILVGVNVLRNLKREPWERYCWWIAFVIFVILMGTGIILNIVLPVPDFYPKSDFSAMSKAREDFFNRYPYN
ncbi:unnamed protein product, partial [Meganyctiphanes norvegica]